MFHMGRLAGHVPRSVGEVYEYFQRRTGPHSPVGGSIGRSAAICRVSYGAQVGHEEYFVYVL